MKLSQCIPKLALVSTLAIFTGTSQADPVSLLQGRTFSGQAVATNDPAAVFIYDGYQGITWLRNWNYPSTAMDWATAQSWASGLTVGTFDDWVLPDLIQYSTLWNVEVQTYADLATYFSNVLHL